MQVKPFISSKLFVFCISLLCSVGLLAQEEESELVSYESVIISAHGGLAIPVGNLGDKLNDSGWGGGGSLLFLIDKHNPMYLGLDVSHFTYDQEFFYTDILIDGFLAPVEYRTRANILTGHALFRYAPTINSFLQPYIEGMFGTKHFVTRTRINDLENPDDDTYDQYVEDGDWALSYGGAIGVQVPLYYFPNGAGIKLDVRCSYQRGTAASYNVRRDNWLSGSGEPINAFELENSTTDLLIPKIGVLFSFGKKVFYNDYED